MRKRYSLLELNPANFTAKGERMYDEIKRGYQSKGDPRAKEIAARTVYARAAEGVPGLVKPKAKQNPGGDYVDEAIVMGMERAIWVTSYADWADNQPRETEPKKQRTAAWRVASGRAKVVHRAGPGEDWNDVAPESPASAGEAAEDLRVAIERKNGKTLSELLDDAAKADGVQPTLRYADSFGHYLAMQAMGHGVSWFDNHKTFPLKLPHFEFHTFDGEEVEWSPRIRSRQNPCGGTRST